MHPQEAPTATPEQILREIVNVVTQLRRVSITVAARTLPTRRR